MFEPSRTPRLFQVAPGIDFPHAVIEGLDARMKDQPPEALARVEIFVNTARMRRRLIALFADGPPRLLPRIRLITDLAHDPSFADIPPPIDGLTRRLDLMQLTRKLIETLPEPRPVDSAFDLADSLVSLMDEMQGEGVAPEVIAKLDVEGHADHWRRAQRFIEIVAPYFNASARPDTQARQRRIVSRLAEQWETEPPQHPVIIAGSTGSRGTTHMLMKAIAGLPQGAVILPGFDTDMPQDVWDILGHTTEAGLTHEDHPQYRFHKLMTELNLRPEDVPAWTREVPQNPARNALISAALRPAPVTDGWIKADLGDVAAATRDLTLLEAPSPRIEAVTIAMRLREAIENGEVAALITPDRMLTRQVTAALDRWRIEPDDSAGTPLTQSPVGRLLRQLAELMYQPLTPERLLALLKHPLVHQNGRGDHLKHTRDLELERLRCDMPSPDRAQVTEWAGHVPNWADWIFDGLDLLGAWTASLETYLDRLTQAANHFAAGPEEAEHTLWHGKNGEEAVKILTQLADAALAAGPISPREFADIFQTVLNDGEVRDPLAPHPNVMIWGTLEARVQGADLVILAGLNEGIWPETPAPDPWLNRQMRLQAGLLLPERKTGLAAHDFQQAVAAREVWLCRSVRDAEAETVPSRWLNRLGNLMRGLNTETEYAYADMKARGQDWLAKARALETPTPVAKATRPSPAPPKEQRPQSLSVTRIETLIRDPYEIYARHVLGLKKLRPLNLGTDAPLRGQVIHKVLERFIAATPTLPSDPYPLLMQIADDALAEMVPLSSVRSLWRARLDRAATWFLISEIDRRAKASPIKLETTGQISLALPDFKLTGRADRIDMTPEGQLMIYDYKTGTVPTHKQQTRFDFQLPLLAKIAEAGGYEELAAAHVTSAAHIGVGASPIEQPSKIVPDETATIWDNFLQLIASYATDDKGYTARRAIAQTDYAHVYDQLARFGEWDQTDPASLRKVGQ